MNVLIVGLGSMGKRRARLAKGMDKTLRIIGVDTADSRREEALRLGLADEVYPTIAEAAGAAAPEAALVCTAPLSHAAIIGELLDRSIPVFTELNLVDDGYDENIAKAKEKGVVLFLSSTMLYRRETQYIKRRVTEFGRPVHYIYHIGQYLPDWHPWENYKNFFVSNKKTNACREILAIEFPWIVKAFGEIESVHVMRDKNSTLELDFPDNYMISIRHKNGNKGVFCQDVISRKGLRRLEVYSERLHLFWEGTPQSLSVYDIDKKELQPIKLYGDVEQRAGYNANIIENAYREELVNFFDVLQGVAAPRHSFERDKSVLDLIDGIEEGRYD